MEGVRTLFIGLVAQRMQAAHREMVLILVEEVPSEFRDLLALVFLLCAVMSAYPALRGIMLLTMGTSHRRAIGLLLGAIIALSTSSWFLSVALVGMRG